MLIASYFPGWKSPSDASWYNPSPWLNSADGLRFMGDYPERHPLHGPIDEDQQWVIDRHLEDADRAGISAFAVCWYRDEYLNYALEKMKASSSQSPVKFCVLWANSYPQTDTAKAQKSWFLEGVRRMAMHTKNPRALWIDGKPVFIIYSVSHLDDVIRATTSKAPTYTPTQAEVNALSDEIADVIGNVFAGDSTGGISGLSVSKSNSIKPYLVLMTKDKRWQRASSVCATTLYNVRQGMFGGVTRMARSYKEMSEATEQANTMGAAVAERTGKHYFSVLMAGVDSSAWGGYPADPQSDNCVPTPGQLEQAAAQVADFAKQAGSPAVFMYAWNELGEGGYVCPTKGTGYSRIDALAKVFR